MCDGKLATTEIITGVRPIKGADRIELVDICGTQCVVPEGQYKVGDMAVYIRPGSLLPDIKCFSFAAKYGYRVKKTRYRGEVSDGLVMPLSWRCELGEDMTEIYGVTKWQRNTNLENKHVPCKANV